MTTLSVEQANAERLIAALNLAAYEAGRFRPETLDAALALAAVRAACREAAVLAAGEGPYAAAKQAAGAQPEPVRA